MDNSLVDFGIVLWGDWDAVGCDSMGIGGQIVIRLKFVKDGMEWGKFRLCRFGSLVVQ